MSPEAQLNGEVFTWDPNSVLCLQQVQPQMNGNSAPADGSIKHGNMYSTLQEEGDGDISTSWGDNRV